MKTTNFEISKQLAEAGFKADTNFYWYCHDRGEELRHISEADGTGNFKSYDLETLIEALPDEFNNYLGEAFLSFNKTKYCTSIGYGNDIEYIENLYVRLEDMEEGSSLADTAGRLLLLDDYPFNIRKRELICKNWQTKLRFLRINFWEKLCLKPSGLRSFARLPLALNLLSVFIRREVLPL